MLSCPVSMRYNLRTDRKNTYLLLQSGGLEALRAVRTTFPLVYQCQRALNDISDRHAVGVFGSPDMLEHGAMKLPMGSRGAALLWDSSDPSRPWGCLGEIY